MSDGVIDRRRLMFAACCGAIAATVAYFIAHGSIIVFILVMVGLGVGMRVWAIRYRMRHGLPLRGRPVWTNRHLMPGRLWGRTIGCVGANDFCGPSVGVSQPVPATRWL